MKYIGNKKLWLTAFCALNVLFMLGQQSQQKIELDIDPLGNAKIQFSETMNAQQWQQWLTVFGNNPALFKREMERGLPAYFLDDFTFQKDDINRSYNLGVSAYGVCEIDKRGNWAIDLDQKNAQVTELTPHKYMMVVNPEEFGGQIQQTYVISFPETASNIKLDKDAYGNDIFEFKMAAPSRAGLGGLLPWVGLLFVVGGVSWLIVNKLKFNK